MFYSINITARIKIKLFTDNFSRLFTINFYVFDNMLIITECYICLDEKKK